MLKAAKVWEFLDKHVQQAEQAMGASEVIERLAIIARLPDTELADMKDFIRLIGPEEAVKAIKKSGNLEEAKAALHLIGSDSRWTWRRRCGWGRPT